MIIPTKRVIHCLCYGLQKSSRHLKGQFVDGGRVKMYSSAHEGTNAGLKLHSAAIQPTMDVACPEVKRVLKTSSRESQ
jgi:hypothetical protein